MQRFFQLTTGFVDYNKRNRKRKQKQKHEPLKKSIYEQFIIETS